MKLLMADDDHDDREMLKIAFEEQCPGHQLELVCDGEELMKCLERCYADGNLPDIILLDLNMPRKDGKTALREIKADARFKNIPVVIYSTSNSEDDKTETQALGAKAYIIKPYGFNDLLTVCKNICA